MYIRGTMGGATTKTLGGHKLKKLGRFGRQAFMQDFGSSGVRPDPGGDFQAKNIEDRAKFIYFSTKVHDIKRKIINFKQKFMLFLRKIMIFGEKSGLLNNNY